MLESYVALVSLVKFILAWKGLNYSTIFKSRLSGRGRREEARALQRPHRETVRDVGMS